MLTRRSLFLGAACAGLVTTVRADNSAALAFVNAIYSPYKGKNAKGIALNTDAELQRYFEPSLAALISKDRKDARRRDEVPTLDGDPFVDAQEWDIKSFDIAVTSADQDKASATVKFANQGRPSTIVLDLVSVGGNWRIHDITYQYDDKPETLRGLFAQ
jgi:hypothetical protein